MFILDSISPSSLRFWVVMTTVSKKGFAYESRTEKIWSSKESLHQVIPYNFQKPWSPSIGPECKVIQRLREAFSDDIIYTYFHPPLSITVKPILRPSWSFYLKVSCSFICAVYILDGRKIKQELELHLVWSYASSTHNNALVHRWCPLNICGLS